jgi:hypothetical protein
MLYGILDTIDDGEGMTNSFDRDHELGLIPSVPLPFYVWTRLWWQKVRCGECGKEFISRDLGLMPPEYRNHYALNHIDPLESECA